MNIRGLVLFVTVLGCDCSRVSREAQPVFIAHSGPLPPFPQHICNQTWSQLGYLPWLVEDNFLTHNGGQSAIPLDDQHTMYLAVSTRDNSAAVGGEQGLREKAEALLAQAVLGTNHRTAENHETRSGRKVENGIEDAQVEIRFRVERDNLMKGTIPAYDIIGSWSSPDATTDFYALGTVVKNDGIRTPFGQNARTNPFLNLKKSGTTREELQQWSQRNENQQRGYVSALPKVEELKVRNQARFEQSREKARGDQEKLEKEKVRREQEAFQREQDRQDQVFQAQARRKKVAAETEHLEQKQVEEEFQRKVQDLEYQHRSCVEQALKLDKEYRLCLVNLQRVHITMEPQVRRRMVNIQGAYLELLEKDRMILARWQSMVLPQSPDGPNK